jgi:hypothetical protein
MGIIALLLFIGLLSQRNQPAASTNAAAGSGVDSMTGDLHFASTFSKDDSFNSYWQQSDNASMLRQITPDGFYHLHNERPSTAATSIFGANIAYRHDFSITMKAGLQEGSSPPSGYGIVFRYLDEDHYNVFAVDGVGRYSIWVRDNGRWRELRAVTDDWTQDPAVQPMGKPNTLTLDVRGNQFTGYVNDQQVTSVTDSTIPAGSVGIYLATPAQGSADVLVDSYQVGEVSVQSMTGDETEVPSMTGG